MEQKRLFMQTPIANLWPLINESLLFADKIQREDEDTCHAYFSIDNIKICTLVRQVDYGQVVILAPNKLILIARDFFERKPYALIYELISEIECDENNYPNIQKISFENSGQILLIDENPNLREKTITQLLQNKLSKNARNI